MTKLDKDILLVRESKHHWIRMRDGVGDDEPYTSDCALCNEYHQTQAIGNKCLACPIYKDSGMQSCMRTPYGRAEAAWYKREVAELENMSLGLCTIRHTQQEDHDYQGPIQDMVDYLINLEAKLMVERDGK